MVDMSTHPTGSCAMISIPPSMKSMPGSTRQLLKMPSESLMLPLKLLSRGNQQHRWAASHPLRGDRRRLLFVTRSSGPCRTGRKHRSCRGPPALAGRSYRAVARTADEPLLDPAASSNAACVEKRTMKKNPFCIVFNFF